MGTAHKPLHLYKWRLVQYPTTDIQILFIVIWLDEAFKYGDGAKSSRYVGKKAEQDCLDFCNSVQCHILVHYLTFYVPP
jgi:hypothetical protein